MTNPGARHVVPANRKADETRDASSSHEQNPANRDIHAVPSDTVYTILGSSLQGLTSVDAAQRLSRYGKNTIREEHATSLIVKFAANFTHLMALLLWVGGAIGFVAQMPQLGIAIWTVNLINGLFSFWQEYQAEQAVAALRRLLPTYARVLREGNEQRIPAAELVPGDILLLSDGDHISADGRVIAEAALRVDQSTLTGESYPVRKTADAVASNRLSRPEPPNVVFAGTNVVAGTGRAVIFATGMNTEFGKIAHLTQSMQEELSPLQQEMIRATKVVTVIAVGVGALFFLLAIALTGVTLSESFIFAMGMIVAFVPEGMVPTVTLALAMGTQRMARRHALIKRLSAVETLGCTTVICTDKTGTLTQNEMTVRSLWVGSHDLMVTGVGYSPEGQILDNKGNIVDSRDGDVRALLLALGLCNDARLLPPNSESPQWTILGDPTEAALHVLATKGGIDLEREALQCPRIRELPFDSRRKCMSTIHTVQSLKSKVQSLDSELQTPDAELFVDFGLRTPDAGLQRVAFVKGAPKEVLALCTQINRDGHTYPLDDTLRSQILAANDEYARRGLRMLAAAQRVLPASRTEYAVETVECDLTFLGLVAMLDPPRPEVSDAITKCHRAGIRVIMITGDYGLTAESIAQRIGILRSQQPRVITGADLTVMDEATLQHALKDEVIFARVAPEHKLRVVATLQSMGHVVAVTGDGVNDAPALKKADIGIAMGVAGTDVAKEAADMILTDDNFASIVSAIEEGRAVYANIKKFLTYIFTSNTPEAVPFIVFAFSGGRIPLALNVMQILAIDLGTDLVPALALGAEPPEPGVMDQPPRNRNAHVITRSLLIRAYLWLGLLQSVGAMAAFYFAFWMLGYGGQWTDLPATGPVYQAATAMTLGCVVATQIGNLFAQRTETVSVLHVGLWGNRLVWVGIATEVLLLVLIVYVPTLQWVFGTAAFPARNWLFLLAWVPSLVLADEVRKAIVRNKSKVE